eukprot:2672492-Rhodomonas_salina.1
MAWYWRAHSCIWSVVLTRACVVVPGAFALVQRSHFRNRRARSGSLGRELCGLGGAGRNFREREGGGAKHDAVLGGAPAVFHGPAHGCKGVISAICLRGSYAVSGTEVAYAARTARAWCYQVKGTVQIAKKAIEEVGYAIRLRACYAMPSTEWYGL